jgi:peptide/nickel transport system ATP-binding protein
VDSGGLATSRVSFSVEAAGVACVLGAEGAGKSRLLRCIGLDFPPAAGSILVRGVDVTGATSDRRRQLRARTIELVHPPAPAGVVDTTVPGARAGMLVAPGNTPTTPVAGMRQRIQIAKALVHGAEVLLLDEPFVGVEPGVQVRIVELLDRLRAETETAVVVASRDPEVARALADHVIVLADGEVVEEGPVAEVLDSPSHPRTRQLVEDRRSA